MEVSFVILGISSFFFALAYIHELKGNFLYKREIVNLMGERDRAQDRLEKLEAIQKNPSEDLSQFINDLTKGSAVIRIEPISTENLFLYRNKR